MKIYPVQDQLRHSDRKQLKLIHVSSPLPSLGIPVRDIHAVATGEFRNPKAGEWYLSGAIVGAYRAPNDLLSPYHIARLVKTKTVTTVVTEIVQ